MRVKHECKQYTRAMKGYKNTCEENYFLVISNLALQVPLSHLTMLEFILDVVHDLELFYFEDLRTNLFEEGGNNRDQVT